MALTECNNAIIIKEYSPIIQQIGQKWHNDENNPINDFSFKNSVQKWESFIKNWASDKNIPLLIRKKDNDLGTINIHNTGRELVPVDNSPAQWVYACVCNNKAPPNNIIEALKNEQIPIAMVPPKLRAGTNAYRGKLQKCPNTSTLGWYLGHKKDVGLHKKMFECTIAELIEHFLKLMSPSNMFVVPKESMGGLAELNDFIQQQ